MEKYKPFVILGSAIIIALLTSILMYARLQKGAKPKILKLETQEVLVAMIDLSWGTAITEDMIKKEFYLKKSLPPGYYSNPSYLVGRIVLFPIKANEPILESRLAPRSIKTGGVAAVISHKKRAVAVKVDKPIGVAGFIQPGNRVDVLVTITTGKNPFSITKIVLENILVLAAGPETERKGKEEKPTDVENVTLEVTPEEAEKLALAVTEGKLQLALRNFSDTEDVITKGATIPSLLASYFSFRETKGAKAASNPARPKTQVGGKKSEPEKTPIFTVDLIKGDKVSKVKFEGELNQ